MTFLNLLNVIKLYVVEFLTKGIGLCSICFHRLVENIWVIDDSSKNVSRDVAGNGIEISMISCYLFWFPLFVNCFLKRFDKL